FERLSRTKHAQVSEECLQSATIDKKRLRAAKSLTLTEAFLDAPVNSNNNNDIYRILCTATRRKINWGSYELRCRDLEIWAKRCAPNVLIQTGRSFQDFERLRWFRSKIGQMIPEEQIYYNASIFVKSYPNSSLPLYGKMFMDMVDEYWVPDSEIPPYVELILQTKWQGDELFSTHNYSVVEHWYNSYPADMAISSGDPDDVPKIEDEEKIHIATVWNTRRSHDPTEGGCPKLQLEDDTSYYCIDKEFDISKWYVEKMKRKDSQCEMEHTLADPQLGPGKLYYNLFRKYDALVVLAKNHTDKLTYGNVQRTVSQMRSGVPVLVEIRGKVLEDFMQQYNYTCAFQRYPSEIVNLKGRKLWSFQEAVEQLKDVKIRRKCQLEGLNIARSYSPNAIGQKFLRIVGYQGDFQC
ncbi:MAG: hypothetical protein SGILL_006068, partial [Bacillariaceae sp.]